MSQTQTRTTEQLLDLSKDLAVLQALLMTIDQATEEERTRTAGVAIQMLAAVDGASLDNATVLKYLEDKYLGQ